MAIFQYIIGFILITFGILLLIINYGRLIHNLLPKYKKQGWVSPTPLIVPFLIIVGYLILPIKFNNLIFLIIIIDPDTLLTIISLPWLIKNWN